MKEITIKDAERIRKQYEYTMYEFSMKLGFSPTAYLYSFNQKRLSRRMQREVSRRYREALRT
jgi:hypothetical protein